MVTLAKFSGTPEEEAAYQQGVSDERERMLKILKKYHETFGGDEELSDSTTKMDVKYMYNFIMETRSVK